MDTTPPKPVRKVVIAGGGTAGWMVAACLAKTMGRLLDIKLVESDEIGTVGVGEATIPPLQIFHQLLGLDEREFMAATLATFKLGIRFEHWRAPGQHYIHSFGMTGKDHWTAGFQHFWLEGRARGLARDYGDYCLELRAAEENRFAHLPRGGMNYAYHFDATRYAAYLRKFSESFGAQRLEGKIQAVNLDPASRHIRSLTLASGAEVEGDLFIDCTGFRALLIGEALKVPYEDWSHWLPCDSAMAVQTASVGDAVPYTCSTAHPAGWQWRIPLQHRVGNGLVYASRHLSDDEARSRLLAHVQGELLTTPRVLKFRPGQRREVWRANCVAIGLASGFIEPLESTSIHLIQRGTLRLMQMFPCAGISPADVAEYNRQAQDEIEHIRDFVVLHYHVTERDDSDFWRYCRTMQVPDSLRHRIELFRDTGRVFRNPNHLFAENSWVQVMMGQGLTPRQHHPIAELMGDEELSGFLEGIRGPVNRTLAQLPAHEAYVRQYCGVQAVPA
ncbi:MAG: tryptophan halogenase family protein [Pseudomonadota bacterium]